MSLGGFYTFLWAMSAVALMVFIALYFVKAGYGMFRTASWGVSIPNKVAWVLPCPKSCSYCCSSCTTCNVRLSSLY